MAFYDAKLFYVWVSQDRFETDIVHNICETMASYFECPFESHHRFP